MHLGANKKFYYHQQSIEYVNRKLRELSNIDHGQGFDSKYIDQSREDSGLKGNSVVGPPGFEPESIEPKSTSLDQASRRPHSVCGNSISHAPIKTLSTSQSKTSFVPSVSV